MIEVVTAALGLLDRGAHFVKLALLVAESYMLLGGSDMLAAQGADLAAALLPLVGAIPPDGATVLCRVLDLLLSAYPEDGAELIEDVVHAILMLLLEHGDAVWEDAAGLYAPYMMVVTRLILLNPAFFCDLCDRIAAEADADPANPLIDQWLDKFDVVGEQQWRKLSVLALASTLDCPPLDAYIHPRFSLVVNMLVCGLHQFHVLGEEELPVDFLVRFHPSDEPDVEDDPEMVATEPGRRREASRRDAVFTTNLRDFVGESLTALVERIGADAFHELQRSVDAVLMAQLERFVAID